MGSLKDCLEKIYGFGTPPEYKALERKVKELRKQGYSKKEADLEAVKYFRGKLAEERESVMESVKKAAPARAPEDPNQTKIDFAAKQETGAPSGMASKGRFATEKSEGPAAGSFHEVTSPFIDMPELVEIARGLMKGKFPEVRRWIHQDPGVTGWFRPTGAGKIALRADIFKEWQQAAATLAHEIGHLVDYIPEGTMARGNILGRIASLKGYMKHTMPKAPGAPGELTAEDRKRLKAEAKKLLEAESKDKVIDEEIVKTMPITADDVLAIWNAAAKTAGENQDLYRYIAKLDTAGKKAVVKEALKGQVASELQQFAKSVREKTGKQIPYTITEQEILKKYETLIQEELKKRELLDRDQIMEELKGLSRAWKPFDPQTNREYTRYRYSSKELYADAFSAMMNSPELVRIRAPKFYEAWFNYLDTAKPELAELYHGIVNRTSAGKLMPERVENLRNMMERNDRLYGIELQGPKKTDLAMRDHVDANWFLIKPIHKIGERNIPAVDNPRYKMEDLSYTFSEIEWMTTDIFRNVVRPLEKAGLTWTDLGETAFHKRVTAPESEWGGRSDKANPLGWHKNLSLQRLEEMRQDPVAWKTVEDAAKQFKEVHEYVIDKLEKAEIFGPDIPQKMRDAKNYWRFDVAEYLEKRYGRGAGMKIYRQYGTLKEITNPATATLMRDISFVKSINRQIAARTVVKFLRKHFPTEVSRAQKNRFGRIEEPKDPTQGMIVYLEHGKLKAWNVPKDLAEIFDENPIAQWLSTMILRTFGNFFRTIFTEINPGYWMFNVKRDFSRAQANLPGVWGPGTVLFAKEWAKALKPAFKSVFGIPDPVIEEMQKGNMLISVADIRGMRPEDAQIEKLLKQFHLRPMSWKEHILNPFGSAFTYWSNIGRALERTTKVAGYRWMKRKFPDMTREELAHIVRNTGSPDFLRGGRLTPLTNNLFLFSNAMVQGYRGDYEAMTSRGKAGFAGWWAKRLYRVALPKLLMFAASLGILVEGVRRIMDGISEYDKTNYLNIPLGLAPNGSSVFLRIPTDETGRFIGGVFWKALNFQKPDLLASLADYTAGQAPTLNPALDILFDTVQYASGLNPYDHFHGRYAIPEQIFKAGGERSKIAFAKYLAQKAGSSLYKFQNDDVEKIRGELEQILGLPFVSSTLGRFLKVSDYGLKEQSRQAREEVSGRRAGENLDVQDTINKMVAGKDLEPDDLRALQVVAVREINDRLLGGQKITGKDLPILARTLTHDMVVALGRKYGNVFVQEWMAANNNEEREAVMKTFARINKQMGE